MPDESIKRQFENHGVVPMDWADRTVLVTGADGFIGSHLTQELIQRGSRVVAAVRRTSRSQVTRRFQNLPEADIRRLHGLLHVDLAGPSASAILAGTGAQVWFHLAADAYVPASLTQPAPVVHTNVTSTLNVLEAARMANPEHVLITSSSEIYGTHDGPINEHDSLNPSTPYAAAKVACDRLAWSYYNTFHLPVTIVRPFNCYGPRHVYDVIPKFLVNALRGEELIVNGTGKQTRDMTYVLDTVDAFVRLAELRPAGEAYNVGTGVDHAILDLAAMIVEMSNSGSKIRMGPPRAGEVFKLQADPTKLMYATGWRPRFDLLSGLPSNLQWMQENLDQI